MSSTESSSDEKKLEIPNSTHKGFFSRIWHGLFRKKIDFETRLQYIHKEEAVVLARMKRRSTAWRKLSSHLIILSICIEAIAISFAIMTTRSIDMNWKIRAIRILPMFLVPFLFAVAYSALTSFIKMCDQKDNKTLKKLRNERQTKINELKEKTNYYNTQLLIQKYDPDPAAKAAAATVLASKLGEDSGLKVFLGDEPTIDHQTERDNKVKLVQDDGLRNRKHVHAKSGNASDTMYQSRDDTKADLLQYEAHHLLGPVTVEHFNSQMSNTHGGWISRIAALLVGEDPTQSFALICGNCHMHNGLVRREEFPVITYFCPHCNALNQPKKQEGFELDSHSTATSTSGAGCVSDLRNNSESPKTLACDNVATEHGGDLTQAGK